MVAPTAASDVNVKIPPPSKTNLSPTLYGLGRALTITSTSSPIEVEEFAVISLGTAEIPLRFSRCKISLSGYGAATSP